MVMDLCKVHFLPLLLLLLLLLLEHYSPLWTLASDTVVLRS
jgi:hypothetical protein